MMRPRLPAASWLLVSAALATTASCAAPRTAPPLTDAAVVETHGVRWSMQYMASRVRRLDALLETPGGVRPGDAAMAAQLLDDIEGCARALAIPGETPRHPVMQGGMPALAEEARRAREAALLPDANLDPARVFTGRCTACHELRMGR